MASDALQKFVGVDVGGTNIVAAVVAADGTVKARFKQDTKRGAPKEELSNQIAEAVEAALAAAKCSKEDIGGIGIAVPGVVDAETGRIVVLPNLNIRDVPLREEMTQRFCVPVAVGNDVNLGTLAEVWIGAARDVHDVVGVFVGTGIGGGVVVNGKLRTGASEQAGEVGHMTVQLDGPLCGCGNTGCWEALASRTAIERDIRAAATSGEKTILCPDGSCPNVIKSSALKKALAEQDPVAERILRRAAEVLGIGARTIRHLIDPEMIVFGGGVIEACGDFMLPIIRQVIADDKLSAAREGLQIEQSKLGDDAVFLGAVALLLSDLGLNSETSGIVEKPAKAPKTGKKSKKNPSYPELKGLKFGSVKVDEVKFESDIWVFADGRVEKRKKKLAREQHGTSHVIDVAELKVLLDPIADELIIGTGLRGMARVAPEAEKFLEKSGVKWQALPSEQAVSAYNEIRGCKALLLHVTC